MTLPAKKRRNWRIKTSQSDSNPNMFKSAADVYDDAWLNVHFAKGMSHFLIPAPTASRNFVLITDLLKTMIASKPDTPSTSEKHGWGNRDKILLQENTSLFATYAVLGRRKVGSSKLLEEKERNTYWQRAVIVWKCCWSKLLNWSFGRKWVGQWLCFLEDNYRSRLVHYGESGARSPLSKWRLVIIRLMVGFSRPS